MNKERFIQLHKQYGINESLSGRIFEDLSRMMDMQDMSDETVIDKIKKSKDVLKLLNMFENGHLEDLLGMTNSQHTPEVIGTYSNNDIWVDTRRVWDSEFKYETAVKHPRYNYCKPIIVENYNDPKDAIIGHNQWIKTMTVILPDELVDVSQCRLAKLIAKMGDTMIYKRNDSND